MPAVGDIRSRLMALADDTVTGNPEVYELAGYRLPSNRPDAELMTELHAIVNGEHELIKSIPNPMRRLVRLQLGFFVKQMPRDFNLKGASIGNLILTGGYLNYERHLDPILFLFSKLLAIKGVVRPVINDPLHLAVILENGKELIGQHLITGKETAPIDSRVRSIQLSETADELVPAKTKVRGKIAKLISSAEIICYPPGSFYTSVIANLLPAGVGRKIAANSCPKIYVPNLGSDPEQKDMSLLDCISVLLHYLRLDAGQSTPTEELINYILVDSKSGILTPSIARQLAKLNISVIDTPLMTSRSAPYYDNEKLAHALLSLT